MAGRGDVAAEPGTGRTWLDGRKRVRQESARQFRARGSVLCCRSLPPEVPAHGFSKTQGLRVNMDGREKSIVSRKSSAFSSNTYRERDRKDTLTGASHMCIYRHTCMRMKASEDVFILTQMSLVIS